MKNLINGRRLGQGTRPLAASASVLAVCLGMASRVDAGQYEQGMMLNGAVGTTAVSGFKGTALTLDDSNPEHAVYGLFSVERRDRPCFLALRTESVNDSADDSGEVRDLCGGQATSSELGADYSDASAFGTRVFVTGIRLCMNNDQTRVKGLAIRGKRITPDGALVALDEDDPVAGQAGGSDVSLSLVTEPLDQRTNCDTWKRWVECANGGEVATGIVAHFEAGDQPRSLTGIALQCRNVGRAFVSQ